MKKNNYFPMYKWCQDLFPICRSITGNGITETLKIIKKEFPKLKIQNINSGCRVFDWKIPPEWNINTAFIIDKHGEKIIDFNSWCESKRITPLEASINFIKKNKQIEKIIVGIDSNIQLNDVIKAYYKKINIRSFDIFSVENKFLIDPRRW